MCRSTLSASRRKARLDDPHEGRVALGGAASDIRINRLCLHVETNRLCLHARLTFGGWRIISIPLLRNSILEMLESIYALAILSSVGCPVAFPRDSPSPPPCVPATRRLEQRRDCAVGCINVSARRTPSTTAVAGRTSWRSERVQICGFDRSPALSLHGGEN